VQTISAEAVEYICLNMREEDRKEILGLRPYDNVQFVARETIFAASYGKAAIAFYNNRPCAVVGVSPKWPGVWDAWAYGTVRLPKRGLEITKYALNELKPFILSRGAHRLECQSRLDHHQAHSWLRSLGARDEGILRGYGKDGSDYVSFAWRKDDVLQKPKAS
jgi:hypothetical protein